MNRTINGMIKRNKRTITEPLCDVDSNHKYNVQYYLKKFDGAKPTIPLLVM